MKPSIATRGFGLAFAWSCLAALAAAGEYANTTLLTTPAAIKAYAEGDESVFPGGVTFVDVRSVAAHAAGNLAPGYRIDAGEWKAAFGDGDDAQGWTTRIGAVVHDPKTTVIVYDQTFSPTAARVWWLLRYWGVQDVRILDGGYAAAGAAGVRTYPFAARLSIPSTLIAKPQPDRLATRDEVMQAVAGDSAGAACVVDTRSDREFAAGAIPTARQSDWVRYVDPKTGKLRSADELQALLDEAGFDPNAPAITYCRTGGRASVVAFAMELMGGKQVANYWGSWNDWSAE
ncbi:MAG: rhodanese-like domain-containing protein [Planctomycetota bacterium]